MTSPLWTLVLSQPPSPAARVTEVSEANPSTQGSLQTAPERLPRTRLSMPVRRRPVFCIARRSLRGAPL